jgi:hypothetical protein
LAETSASVGRCNATVALQATPKFGRHRQIIRSRTRQQNFEIAFRDADDHRNPTVDGACNEIAQASATTFDLAEFVEHQELRRVFQGALLQQCGREIVIDRKELLEAFARPQRLIDDPMS